MSVVAVAPSAPPAADEDTAHGLFKAPAANDAPSALVARPERNERKESGPTDDAQRRLIELRAQSRGLWSDSSDKIPAVVTQPRVEKLPRAVLGLTGMAPANAGRAPSMPPMASVRPEISVGIDSDAPTSPPPEVHEVEVSERPTDVRKSLRALSARPSRPSEEPTPDVNRRSTPLVARPDEPFLAEATQPEAAESPASPAELSPSVLEQAAQHGALEAQRRTSTRRASAVLIGCVVLLSLGLALGLWPMPWSTPAPGERAKPDAAAPVAKAPTPKPPTAAPQPQPQPLPTAAPSQPQPAIAAAPQAQPSAAQPPADAPQAQPSAAAAQQQPSAAAPQAPPSEAPQAQPSAAAVPPHPAAAPDAPGPGARAAPTGPLDVGNSLRAVRGHLRGKDPIAAEAILRPLMEQNPEDHHIQELLVQALIDQKRGGEAASLAQKIIKKRPKRALYRVLLGDALRVSGAITAANAAWKEALELEPDNKEALKRLNQP